MIFDRFKVPNPVEYLRSAIGGPTQGGKSGEFVNSWSFGDPEALDADRLRSANRLGGARFTLQRLRFNGLLGSVQSPSGGDDRNPRRLPVRSGSRGTVIPRFRMPIFFPTDETSSRQDAMSKLPYPGAGPKASPERKKGPLVRKPRLDPIGGSETTKIPFLGGAKKDSMKYWYAT